MGPTSSELPPPADSSKGGGAGAPTAGDGRGPKDPGARRSNNIRAVRALISGDVQGVFFRDTCAKKARSEGVAGWVRNRGDGRVEAWFEGRPQAVEKLLTWCREGPPRAEVDDVAVTDVEPASLDAFRIE